GQAVAVATTGKERNALSPNIKTMFEQGYDDFISESWMGLLAPKGVPTDRLAKLTDAMRQALEVPEVQAHIRAASMRPKFTAPDEFRKYMLEETERFVEIYKNTPREQLTQ